MSVNAGWIEGALICSHINGQNRKYWIEDDVIFGPKNSGKFWIKNGYIYGPNEGGDYWIDGGRIYGSSEVLPFTKLLEISRRVIADNMPHRDMFGR
jgi:hypothetical protein